MKCPASPLGYRGAQPETVNVASHRSVHIRFYFLNTWQNLLNVRCHLFFFFWKVTQVSCKGNIYGFGYPSSVLDVIYHHDMLGSSSFKGNK